MMGVEVVNHDYDAPKNGNVVFYWKKYLSLVMVDICITKVLFQIILKLVAHNYLLDALY